MSSSKAKGAAASKSTAAAGKPKIGGKATLVMENGMTFEGTSFGSSKSTAGEIVFNTGMMGYPGSFFIQARPCLSGASLVSYLAFSLPFLPPPALAMPLPFSSPRSIADSLTDPSYRGQILLATYPIVGNYGVPPGTKDGFGLNENWESSRIQTKGMIVADYCHEYSHWKAAQSLSDWLIEYDVPGITGVDTRMLTKIIRDAGEMKGKIIIGDQDVSWDIPELIHPVSEVSCAQPYTVGKGDVKILAIDTGMKDSMLRCLVARGATVKVVPHNWDISKEQYDGLFLSNGPGDPIRVKETTASVKHAIAQDKPIFGICLGSQLMGLAAGASTYKLPFGHRGQNQPCINTLDERCYITSQNHSYAIDGNTLPEGWSPLFVNANDGSIEGIYHKNKPFFSVQFHPEARCGPEDTHFLFDKFLDTARRHKQKMTFDPAAGLYPFISNESVGLKLGSGAGIKSAIEFPKVYSEPLPKKVLVLGSGGLQIGQGMLLIFGFMKIIPFVMRGLPWLPESPARPAPGPDFCSAFSRSHPLIIHSLTVLFFSVPREFCACVCARMWDLPQPASSTTRARSASRRSRRRAFAPC
jgi:carbamoyl-phosphate synthase small subunit